MSTRIYTIISRMNIGGPAVLIAELINNFPENEFEHTLITGRCTQNERDFLENLALCGSTIYLENLNRKIFLLDDLRTFIQLCKILRVGRPDLVHTHTSKAGVIGRLATRLASPNTKIVHTFHGHLLYGYFPRWKRALVILVEKVLSRITDSYVSVATNVERDLREVGIGNHRPWVVIEPGVELHRSAEKEILGNGLQHLENYFTITWIGRFTDIKNPLLAVESYAKMLSNFNGSTRMIMAGAGELLEDAKILASNLNLNIEFLGWIEDVAPLLSVSDVLLMTSKNEGMPVVIVEAASLGVPTLSTSVGGVGEFIADGQTGWLVNQDQEEIGLQLLKIYGDKDLLSRVRLNVLDLARKRFSVFNFVEKHLQLYRKLLNVN